MLPVFLSFYTPTYAAEAKELVRTLDQHKLIHDVRPVPSRGSWERNCSIKPEYIRDRMLDHEGHPVVWVDADARIMRPPTLLTDIGSDFAAHWKDGVELLSGTLYFAASPGAWRIVQAWVAECQKNPMVWDQKSLQKVVESDGDICIQNLPAGYTQIFDLMSSSGPATILHTQASRKLKSAVKAG